ncbi:hypothetical protein [Psychromonas hadalis]|uniref:hypothetical protein n=1 Tax=Psychromonas hadalis TaxID=211669 RepID=UPI0003B5A1A0|nr:hypothetical protein [Psychromonas hadalis]
MALLACTWLWIIQADKIKKAILSLLLLGLILTPLTYRCYQIMPVFTPHGIGDMNAQSGANR